MQALELAAATMSVQTDPQALVVVTGGELSCSLHDINGIGETGQGGKGIGELHAGLLSILFGESALCDWWTRAWQSPTVGVYCFL